MKSKTALLSQALTEAGFTNKHALCARYRRAWKATGEPPDVPYPQSEVERGWFRYFTDYPRYSTGPKRHKFEIHTNSEEDAQEGQSIVNQIVPDATTWLSQNGKMVIAAWREK